MYSYKVCTSAAYESKENQVRPFNVTTSDGEVLFAWHVLPVALYTEHEKNLLEESEGLPMSIEKTRAFKLLTSDPESRLVINCPRDSLFKDKFRTRADLNLVHGNAGSVAQGWRTDSYRTISSGASDKIHVLAFDYRGFGYSTGSPTERGLITDGVTLVNWAMEIARIPPDRIILLGQSLGTAVLTAVAEHFALERHLDFAGIVLVAGFSDIPTLTLSYSIGGIVPILSPLRPYPALQSFFAKRIQDTWETSRRLASLVRKCRNIELTLIHSRDDSHIPWMHSQTLFYSAANATSKQGMTLKQINSVMTREDLGEAGWVNTWTAAGQNDGGTKRIRQEIVKYGGKYLEHRVI